MTSVRGEMDGHPLLSVLMPVYNEARTLRQVVEAVQAVPLDKEIILVDDGSCDGSSALIDALAVAPHVERVQFDALVVGLEPDRHLPAVGERTRAVHARGETASAFPGSFFCHALMIEASADGLVSLSTFNVACTWPEPGMHLDSHSSQLTFAFNSTGPAATSGPILSGTRSTASSS